MINHNTETFEFQRDFNNPQIIRLIRSSPQLGVSLPVFHSHQDDALERIASLEGEMYPKELLKQLETEFKVFIKIPIPVKPVREGEVVRKPFLLF